MIEALLPGGVAAREAFGDPPGPPLFPEEEALVARAVDKRRREFATVRRCARTALADLGFPAAPILRGARGAPTWPSGVVGSMTHCDGYRAAAVAHESAVPTIGLDAEPNEPLPDGVLGMVSLPEEHGWLKELGAAAPHVRWDRLLFSAKESVYKAWFPLTRRWLGFEEAVVTPALDGTFTARLLTEGETQEGLPLTGFTGRWLVANGLVLTAIAGLPDDPMVRGNGHDGRNH
ncbi:4'-phosphopantetheinyl transferase superfamily protein [Streptosporangiaceae bacterium NEAU-GS5]|nr:4'-phosphopantetheinyl transferase superfamily protein [Streptosporangiaceae bacterium NEAU-GS5]